MGDNFQKSHAISIRKQDIMREIDHPQYPTPLLDHIHYRWDSPWTKPKKETPTTNIINPNWILLYTCSTISPIRKRILSKTSNPVVQERNSGHTQMEDTKSMTKTQPIKYYIQKFFLISNPSQKYSILTQWRPSPVTQSTKITSQG